MFSYLWPASMRFAYEIFRNDDAKIINLLVLNGWVRFDDANTGIRQRGVSILSRHVLTPVAD
jgi:hypothetical protein